jgi:hypothetical protein
MLKRTLFLSIALSSGLAHADWPTSPSESLYVGPLNNAFDERASLQGSDDGSVWLCWQNNYCVGDLLLQHVTLDGQLLAPQAMAIQDDPTCGFHLPPLLIPIGQSAVASRALSSLLDTPVQRIDTSGDALWIPGFLTDEQSGLGDATRLESGDLLFITTLFNTMQAYRVEIDGDTVWDKPTVISAISANYDVLDVVAQPDGSAMVFWDSHFSYTKNISAMRINADGSLAWPEPIRMNDVPPRVTSSRHSKPSIVDDGAGGSMVVFVRGFEQASTPAPLLMQRIHPDSSLDFPLEGVRISMGTQRQFDPITFRESLSGDIIVVWRNGYLSEQSVYAQRITQAGQRMWGENGIEVGQLDATFGSYDAIWNNDILQIVIAGHDGILMSRIDADGSAFGPPIQVADAMPSSFVKVTHSLGGSVVAWQVDVPDSFDDELVAARVNSMGVLGPEPCSSADQLPDAQLNFFDVSAFLTHFTAQHPAADLTGEGVFDFFDVSAFLQELTAGCHDPRPRLPLGL